MTLNKNIDLYFHMVNHYKKLKQAKSCIDNKIPKGYENCTNRQGRVPTRDHSTTDYNWQRSSQNYWSLSNCNPSLRDNYGIYTGQVRSASVPPIDRKSGISNTYCSPTSHRKIYTSNCVHTPDPCAKKRYIRDIHPTRSSSVPPGVPKPKPIRHGCCHNTSHLPNHSQCIKKHDCLKEKDDINKVPCGHRPNKHRGCKYCTGGGGGSGAGGGSENGKKPQVVHTCCCCTEKSPDKKKGVCSCHKSDSNSTKPPKHKEDGKKKKCECNKTGQNNGTEIIKPIIPTPTTPKPIRPCGNNNTNDDLLVDLLKVEEQEYLHFLLTITEDIIRNGVYTNQAIDKIICCHIQANKGRLDLVKMQQQIDYLIKELNVPGETNLCNTEQKNCKCLKPENSVIFQVVLNKFSDCSLGVVSECTEPTSSSVIGTGNITDSTQQTTTVSEGQFTVTRLDCNTIEITETMENGEVQVIRLNAGDPGYDHYVAILVKGTTGSTTIIQPSSNTVHIIRVLENGQLEVVRPEDPDYSHYVALGANVIQGQTPNSKPGFSTIQIIQTLENGQLKVVCMNPGDPGYDHYLALVEQGTIDSTANVGPNSNTVSQTTETVKPIIQHHEQLLNFISPNDPFYEKLLAMIKATQEQTTNIQSGSHIIQIIETLENGQLKIVRPGDTEYAALEAYQTTGPITIVQSDSNTIQIIQTLENGQLKVVCLRPNDPDYNHYLAFVTQGTAGSIPKEHHHSDSAPGYNEILQQNPGSNYILLQQDEGKPNNNNNIKFPNNLNNQNNNSGQQSGTNNEEYFSIINKEPSKNVNSQVYYVVTTDIDDYKKLIGSKVLKLDTNDDENNKDFDYILVNGLVILKKSYLSNIVKSVIIEDITATCQENVYKVIFVPDPVGYKIPTSYIDWNQVSQTVCEIPKPQSTTQQPKPSLCIDTCEMSQPTVLLPKPQQFTKQPKPSVCLDTNQVLGPPVSTPRPSVCINTNQGFQPAASQPRPSVCINTNQGFQPAGSPARPSVCMDTSQVLGPPGSTPRPSVCINTNQGFQPAASQPRPSVCINTNQGLQPAASQPRPSVCMDTSQVLGPPGSTPRPSVCINTNQGFQPAGSPARPSVCMDTSQVLGPPSSTPRPSVCINTNQGLQPADSRPRPSVCIDTSQLLQPAYSRPKPSVCIDTNPVLIPTDSTLRPSVCMDTNQRLQTPASRPRPSVCIHTNQGLQPAASQLRPSLCIDTSQVMQPACSPPRPSHCMGTNQVLQPASSQPKPRQSIGSVDIRVVSQSATQQPKPTNSIYMRLVSQPGTQCTAPTSTMSYTIMSHTGTSSVTTDSSTYNHPPDTQAYTVLTLLTNLPSPIPIQAKNNKSYTVLPSSTDNNNQSYTLVKGLVGQENSSNVTQSLNTQSHPVVSLPTSTPSYTFVTLPTDTKMSTGMTYSAVPTVTPSITNVSQQTGVQSTTTGIESSTDMTLVTESSPVVEIPANIQLSSVIQSSTVFTRPSETLTQSIGSHQPSEPVTQSIDSQSRHTHSINTQSTKSTEVSKRTRTLLPEDTEPSTGIQSPSGIQLPIDARLSTASQLPKNNRPSKMITRHLSIVTKPSIRRLESPRILNSASSLASSSSSSIYESKTNNRPLKYSLSSKLISSEYDLTPERDDNTFEESSVANLLLDETYRIMSDTNNTIACPENFYKQAETQTGQISLIELHNKDSKDKRSLSSITTLPNNSNSMTDSILNQLDLIDNLSKIPSLNLSATQEMQIADVKSNLEKFRNYTDKDDSPVKRMSINLPDNYYAKIVKERHSSSNSDEKIISDKYNLCCVKVKGKKRNSTDTSQTNPITNRDSISDHDDDNLSFLSNNNSESTIGDTYNLAEKSFSTADLSLN